MHRLPISEWPQVENLLATPDPGFLFPTPYSLLPFSRSIELL
jgi:hypothetical protein